MQPRELQQYRIHSNNRVVWMLQGGVFVDEEPKESKKKRKGNSLECSVLHYQTPDIHLLRPALDPASGQKIYPLTCESLRCTWASVMILLVATANPVLKPTDPLCGVYRKKPTSTININAPSMRHSDFPNRETHNPSPMPMRLPVEIWRYTVGSYPFLFLGGGAIGLRLAPHGSPKPPKAALGASHRYVANILDGLLLP